MSKNYILSSILCLTVILAATSTFATPVVEQSMVYKPLDWEATDQLMEERAAERDVEDSRP